MSSRGAQRRSTKVNYNKLMTKATAKLLKDALKMNWPYATWSVTTSRGSMMDMISVHFDGEADLMTVSAFVDSWEKDDLYISVSGNSYQLV